MASSIQTERRGRRARTGPSRLEVARHAEGTDALGWVLLGFLLGAAAAIAALLHADFQLARPGPAPAVVIPAATARQAAAPAILPPRPDPVSIAPAPAPAIAVTPSPRTPAAPKRTLAERAQVDEDADSRGMTSHAASPIPELY